MDELRIVAITPSRADAQGVIIQGIEDRMRAIFPECKVKVLNADGPNFHVIRRWLEELTVEDVDLVVTIGNRSSEIAAEVFNGRRYPLPTIFCAVSEGYIPAVFKKIDNEKQFLTGVYVEQVSNHVPMQMVLRLYPDISRIFVPYISTEKFGRIRYEIQRLTEYCADRKITVTSVPVDDMQDYEVLREHIRATDLSLVLEGSITAAEVTSVETMCAEEEKPFIGDGQQAIESGGIYCSKEDYLFMGAKVAEYAEQIIKHGKKPSELPPYMVNFSRQLRTPTPTNEPSRGVFLSEDVISSIDGVFLNKDKPTWTVALAMPIETAFTLGISYMLGRLLMLEQRNHYIYRKYDTGWMSERTQQRKRGSLLSGVYEHITFFGDEHAYKVWQHAKKHNMTMPPCTVVTIGDNRVHRKWHNEVRAKGGILIHVALPAPDPLRPLRMLREAAPNIKHVTAFVKEDPNNLPPFLQSRFAQVRRMCKKEGMELRIVGTPLLELTYEVRRKYITHDLTDACFFYQDAVDGRTAGDLVDRCREMGMPICAGGVSFGQTSPLCYGIDLMKLREYLFSYLDVYLRRKVIPDEQEIIFSHDDIYRTCINEKIARRMGLSTLTSFHKHLVDPYHENDIARSMNAQEREDGYLERIAALEEVVEKEAQRIAALMRKD